MDWTAAELNLPSPVQEVKLSLLDRHGVRLFVKREDLIHPTVSGNKWRKLKENLRLAKDSKGIITFGGAFSNHIYATAAAANIAGIPCVGIIRGEQDINNPTLNFAKDQGMKLYFISRSAYRLKQDSIEVKEIISKYTGYDLVPEGGSSKAALVGLKEMAEEISDLSGIDLITVSAGTGMTAAGTITYQDLPVEVFSALMSDHLKGEIQNVTKDRVFQFTTDYHFGGYGKTTDELICFINDFKQKTAIPLDPIYNGKAIYGIIKKIENGSYARGTTILHIHTGGLQGVAAYNYMAAKKGKILIN